jgi:cell division protein FtsQ
VGLYQTALDVKDWLTDASRLPMSELLLQGQHQYLKADELRAPCWMVPSLRNFFELDVNELQARLNALPWVAQVSVRKKWPNKIKVYLTEQAVAARWNGNRFVNTKGEVFSAPDRVKTPDAVVRARDQAVKVLEASPVRNAAGGQRDTSCWG